MKTYNGHRSWNAWNVALWIGNDESIYRFAMECINNAKRHYEGKPFASDGLILNKATICFMHNFAGTKTPDGAKYNHLSVKLALESFIDD